MLEKFLSTKEFDSEQTFWIKREKLFYWKLKWITWLVNLFKSIESSQKKEKKTLTRVENFRLFAFDCNCIYFVSFGAYALRVYNTVKQETIKFKLWFLSSRQRERIEEKRIEEKNQEYGTVFWYRWQTIVDDIVPRIIILCRLLFSTN